MCVVLYRFIICTTIDGRCIHGEPLCESVIVLKVHTKHLGNSKKQTTLLSRIHFIYRRLSCQGCISGALGPLWVDPIARGARRFVPAEVNAIHAGATADVTGIAGS